MKIILDFYDIFHLDGGEFIPYLILHRNVAQRWAEKPPRIEKHGIFLRTPTSGKETNTMPKGIVIEHHSI
jgi:hypothetical protein